jgi:hypothetical protein
LRIGPWFTTPTHTINTCTSVTLWNRPWWLGQAVLLSHPIWRLLVSGSRSYPIGCILIGFLLLFLQTANYLGLDGPLGNACLSIVGRSWLTIQDSLHVKGTLSDSRSLGEYAVNYFCKPPTFLGGPSHRILNMTFRYLFGKLISWCIFTP